MPKNDIGGFFVSLGLAIDKNSWETGNKLIDGMGNSLNKLIGTARNASVVLAGTAIATGSIESQVYKFSQAIGVSTETIDLWKTSAKLAGVDANSLISSMARVSEVMSRMKIDGAGLQEFTTKLGELGIVVNDVDIEKMLNMTPDELMKDVLDKAQTALKNGYKMSDVSLIVKDILGDAGQQLLIELDRQGKSMDQLLKDAGKIIYTDSGTNKESQEFMEQVRITKTFSENISKLLGSDIAKSLTPAITTLNEWLITHGEDIKDSMVNLAGAIEKVVGKTVDFITDDKTKEKTKKTVDAAKDVKNVITGAKDFAKAVSSGDEEKKEEAKEKIITAASNAEKRSLGMTDEEYNDFETTRKLVEDYWDKNSGHKVPWYTNTNRIPYEDLPEDLKADVDRNGGKENFPALKDGIIRPDGTVTQVAPDDWVFAARNIGDMARAFIPQNHTAVSAGEYTINQTFNISGGNDMPQVLRQQAYRGTQEGLLEIMEQSSRRLQLMSGTR